MTGGPAELVPAVIHDLRFADLPPIVVEAARTSLLDLIGVGVGGSRTAMSLIARDLAIESFAGRTRQARLLFDGRRASPAGAALAGAMTIDSLDGHDGHAETKGHVGVTVLPAVAAFADALGGHSGQELLTALVLGYEVGTRAGIALHRTAPDYHASGAWNAVAAAAIGARFLGLNATTTGHALGIAEYHGPRSQMLRAIDHPTMVKDSSGWGALAGVSAAFFAEAGFTGGPALLVSAPEVAPLWDDLGDRWRILEQYRKPWPVCRWAHPAIEAALAVVRAHDLVAEDIATVEISTFAEAARLGHPAPTTTEEAQYSLAFPVAAALVAGDVGSATVGGAALRDPRILRLSAATTATASASYDARFPLERWANVTLATHDGRRLDSGPTRPRGDPDSPLPIAEIRARLDRAFSAPGEADAIAAAIDRLTDPSAASSDLLDLILRPPAPA